MFRTYRAVFRAPGSAAFATAGFVMRIPIATYPIGLVLILSASSGHYSFAGVLSGIYVIANGVGNPVLARLSDRFGQRRLLVPASIVHVVATMLLAVCVLAHWPDWTLVAPTAVSGFAFLSVGSLVRARWSNALAGSPRLTTAYSLESTLDELIFVLGPLIATVLATQVAPVAVLFVSAALVLGGAFWLAAQRGSEPPPQASDAPRHRSAVLERGMPLLTVFAAAMGVIFSSAEVTMVAFCGQHGQRGMSGLALASIALGSALAGLVYGSRTWSADVLTRFRLQSIIFAVLPCLFLLSINVTVLVVVGFVVGFGVAPTLITSFALIEKLVPAASLTEGLAWLITGLSVGYGIGAALVGGIADAHGARTAFLVTIAAGLAMGALAQVIFRRLRASGPASRTPVQRSQHAALP